MCCVIATEAPRLALVDRPAVNDILGGHLKGATVRNIIGIAVCLALGLVTSVAEAQVGFSAHGGSLGVGADVGFAVAPRVTLRVGGNFFPFNLNLTADSIEYTFDFPSPQFSAAVDLFLVGNLRLSAGALYSPNSFSASAAPTQSQSIGGTVYTPAEIGTLTGTYETRKLKPYASIGWGNVAKSTVGFFLDLGVAFQGAPVVTLDATGAVAQADLDSEAQSIADDMGWFQYYPVATVGLSFAIP